MNPKFAKTRIRKILNPSPAPRKRPHPEHSRQKDRGGGEGKSNTEGALQNYALQAWERGNQAKGSRDLAYVDPNNIF